MTIRENCMQSLAMLSSNGIIDRSYKSPVTTEWETAPAVAETPEIKLFGKWSTDDVQINDISLQVSSKR